MSRWYRFLYKIGVTPWEEDATQGPVAEQASTLFERLEEDRRPPFGRALDLGCGSGIWSVCLAQRGWHVTGVDVVPKAIVKARERALSAGVDVRFLEGDVTALRTADVGSGFDFVLDFECFNHLNDVQREAVGRGVNAVAAPDATMLLLTWARGRRWFLPPGASRADIASAFPGWEVTSEEAYAAQSTLPWWLKNIGLRFTWLRHVALNDT